MTVQSIRRKLSKTDFRKHAEFRRWVRRFLATSEANAKSVGLGGSQYTLLLAVKGAEGESAPNIAALADQLLVESHSVVEMVDRCERVGLLERFRQGEDQRLVFVRLTELGNEMVEKVAGKNREEIMEALPTLLEFLRGLV